MPAWSSGRAAAGRKQGGDGGSRVMTGSGSSRGGSAAAGATAAGRGAVSAFRRGPTEMEVAWARPGKAARARGARGAVGAATAGAGARSVERAVENRDEARA